MEIVLFRNNVQQQAGMQVAVYAAVRRGSTSQPCCRTSAWTLDLRLPIHRWLSPPLLWLPASVRDAMDDVSSSADAAELQQRTRPRRASRRLRTPSSMRLRSMRCQRWWAPPIGQRRLRG